MKKILPALFLGCLLAAPVLVLAYEAAPTIIETGEDLEELIATIGNWIFTILLAIAAIFLIMAGFFFITAGGNPEQVNKARQMLINALIGVAVGLGARGLVEVIRNILGG